MFNSPYPNFLNVRSEGNCKCSVLKHRTEFALSLHYKTDDIIIIIIIIIINNLKRVLVQLFAQVKDQSKKMFCSPHLPLDSSSYDGLGEWEVHSCKLIRRASNVTKSLFKRVLNFSKNHYDISALLSCANYT